MDKTKIMLIQKQKSRAKSRKLNTGKLLIKRVKNVSPINTLNNKIERFFFRI